VLQIDCTTTSLHLMTQMQPEKELLEFRKTGEKDLTTREGKKA